MDRLGSTYVKRIFNYRQAARDQCVLHRLPLRREKKFLQKSTSEATSTTQIDGSCNLFPPPFAGITKRNVIKFRYLKIKNLVAPREKKFSIIISFTIERGKRSKESCTRQSHHQHFKKAHNKTGKVL